MRSLLPCLLGLQPLKLSAAVAVSDAGRQSLDEPLSLLQETKIAQLQGITSALELEIGQMEEERRKLK